MVLQWKILREINRMSKRDQANDKRDEFGISYELKGLYIYLLRCKYVSHIDGMSTGRTQVSFIVHDTSTLLNLD
ncbi:hypothetical protein H5410_021807 [Solanum commersonii]|uniref:Uncharacterized protein n=1 Tax=Solanum commersonii TaxID=4109 RepID=A0A9J5ZI69_SOLCO|nr:hypothetical protein H5410_021807 [Solanum commersonii]